ncbi:MAG: hypothetical protein ACKOAR_03085 [Bacteroidota bacterium]
MSNRFSIHFFSRLVRGRLMPVMLLSVLLYTSCSSAGDRSTAFREISSADSLYELSTGDSLQISLGQCIGCADGWKLIFQDTIISADDRGVRSNNSCEDCVGGYGQALFMVKAMHRGEGRAGLEMFGDTVIFRFRVK